MHVPEEAHLIRPEREVHKEEVHVAGTRIFHYVMSVEWPPASHATLQRISRFGALYVGPNTTPDEVFKWALKDATRAMHARYREQWGLSEEVVENLHREGCFGEPFVVAWDLRPNILPT